MLYPAGFSAADADAEGVSASNNEDMQVDNTSVQMVVLDGIVTGPLVCALFDFNSKLMAYLLNHKCCAFEDCMAELANARGSAFCTLHELEYGAKCRVVR